MRKQKIQRCDEVLIMIYREIARDRVKNDIDKERMISFRKFTKGVGTLIKKDMTIRNRLIFSDIKEGGEYE